MPRLNYSKRSAIKQAIEMQGLCFNGAKLLDTDLRATTDKAERARIAGAIGNLCRNWGSLQDSVRVLKGDPMPGAFRPEKPSKTRKCPSALWSLPIDLPKDSISGPLLEQVGQQ